MKYLTSRWSILLSALLWAGILHAQAPASANNGALVDAKGMTLYTFDKDSPSKSVCNDRCADNWPPLAAKEGSKDNGDWTAITRDDGSRQWAYKGHPLYTWAKDMKPGDKTGEGMAGSWHVAKP